MSDQFGLVESFRMISFIMISLAFFVGIMLMVSVEAFEHFNRNLNQEYGIKRRFLPNVEDKKNYFVEFFMLKYPFYSGLLIAILAFVLLLIYKI